MTSEGETAGERSKKTETQIIYRCGPEIEQSSGSSAEASNGTFIRRRVVLPSSNRGPAVMMSCGERPMMMMMR